jgi:hypothetical protein
MIDMDWRQPFIHYICDQKVPTNKNLDEQIIRRAKSYVLVGASSTGEAPLLEYS